MMTDSDSTNFRPNASSVDGDIYWGRVDNQDDF